MSLRVILTSIVKRVLRWSLEPYESLRRAWSGSSAISESFVGDLSVVSAIGSCEIIETLPVRQFGFEIDIVFVTEKLIETLPDLSGASARPCR